MTLTAIAQEFGKSDAAIALSITLTLAFRPVGAFLFGLLADRYGRRLPLMIDLVFYSIVEVLSGLAPDYTTFLILRCLFGIGMGGEWGVGASLAMEKVPPRLRGLLSGFLQQGYAAGFLLAALCYFFVFPRWGWRPLFFLGGLPALLALFVRFKVKESAYGSARGTGWGQLGRPSRRTETVSVLTLLMAMMNFVSHGTQDLYPTFRNEAGLQSDAARCTHRLLDGRCADRRRGLRPRVRPGRLRRTIVAALTGGVLLIPLWAFAPSPPLLVLSAFAMQFMVQGAWGVIPAHITELSPDGVRGFLPGFAYQCGVLIAGSIATMEALLATRVGYGWAMALTAGTVFTLCALVAAAGSERRGIHYGTVPGRATG
jgi:SHS family lactate transporter-like MFS transporter